MSPHPDPSRAPTRRRLQWPLITACCVALTATAVLACGGYDDDSILDSTREEFLAMPSASFANEISRLSLPKTRFRHVERIKVDEWTRQRHADHSLDADLRDISAAMGLGEKNHDWHDVLDNVKQVRSTVLEFHQALEQKRPGGRLEHAPIKLPEIEISRRLPAEFSLYLHGWKEYQFNRPENARKHLQGLLELPAEQRTYRSVWAAYLIARSYQPSDPRKAVEWFIKTRDLAKAGNKDSLGLAAASFGWQARACLDLGEFDNAINLYLLQLSAGDSSAVQSLQVTATAALAAGRDTLARLASDASHRAVLTAYVVANGGPWQPAPGSDRVAAWLDACEAAGAHDVAGADRLAWTAYQHGRYDLAHRWAGRAKQDLPIVQWVQAKLLLREGKIEPAMTLLASAVRGEKEFSDRVGGELGALQLTRRQYADAMTSLARSQHWSDAAYVAETVLTVDELKSGVDQSFADPDRDRQVRHLLARRLLRLGRWKDARPYFGPEEQKQLDVYIAAIRRGHDARLPDRDRGLALFAAARVMRQHGMELAGTELGPDAAIYFGGTELSPPKARTEPLLASSPDELQRLARPPEQLPKRFHYRYTAADHAWAAARLLPENSDELAEVLNTAGGWLKARDPIAAQRFYDALVKRCPNTDLGKTAIERKWFVPVSPDGDQTRSD